MAGEFPYASLSSTEDALLSSQAPQIERLSGWVDDYLKSGWGFFWKEPRLEWAKAQFSGWGEVDKTGLSHGPTDITDVMLLKAFEQKVAEDERYTGIQFNDEH